MRFSLETKSENALIEVAQCYFHNECLTLTQDGFTCHLSAKEAKQVGKALRVFGEVLELD